MNAAGKDLDVARELRSIRKGLDKLREEMRAQNAAPTRDGAVKRAVAAKMMGVGLTKLDALIRAGRVATAQDSHLIPLAEVRRFCAPKPKRERKPAVGHRARMKHVDGTSDEAWDSATRRLRSKAGA